MKIKPLFLASAFSVAMTHSLSAQVTVVNTVASAAINTGGITQLAFTYAPVTPGNTLVFCSYIDNGSVGTGVTFDGVAADGYINGGRSTLAYTRTSDASVNVVVTLSGNGNGNSGYVLYELSNVAAGAVNLSTGNSISTTDDGMFVVSFAGVNNAAITGTAPAVGSIITTYASVDWNSTAGGGGLGYGHGIAGLVGVQTLGWTFPSGGGVGNVAAAFPTGVNPDSDSDGLLDVWELGWAAITDLSQLDGTILSPVGSGDGSGDWDGDTYSDFAEQEAGSNPTLAASVPGDIDADGWADVDEIAAFGNLSQLPGGDFDGDYSTNVDEVNAGTSPTNAANWPDIEPDGMADGWETANGLLVGTDDSGGNADSDGSTNLEEFLAGSDPQDSAWSATNATLAHRWSFTGNLTDSVGGSDAQIANDDTPNVGASSTQNATGFELWGGPKATNDYVKLGSNLLSNLQSDGVVPVTIELWATQDAITNWSRIFNFGTDDGSSPANNESLRMVWSQGADINADQVAWEGQSTAWGPGNSPYVLGVQFHIVMTVVPAVFTNGAIASGTQVTWYSAPVSDSQPEGHPLFGAKGTFNTNSDLRALLDSACTLGRSYYGDNTAAATYDEVRIWNGALSETERELFQLIGPDNMDRSDVDNDGFPDQWELARFGDTTTAMVGVDSDSDGENDEVEFANETNPTDVLSTLADSDKDDLADTWEMQYFHNLLQFGSDDPDFDYVSNEEEETYGSDPTDPNSSPDTDGDGIADGWELNWFGDLETADSTLRPGGTDTDYDGDLLTISSVTYNTDLWEYQNGTDPTYDYSGVDSDSDQLPDYWEYYYFQPLLGGTYLAFNGTNDPDLDTATNAEEFADGTDPNNGSDFKDLNGDGIFDGIVLAATDGFGTTSFNAGTNWTGGAVPVAGKNYLVPSGLRLRTPNSATVNLTFAGAKLAIAGELGLKGDGSAFSANYVFSSSSGTPGILSIVDAGGTVTLGGTVNIQTSSVITAQNGPVAFSGLVSGSGALNLVGPNWIRFGNASNTYSGNITMGSTASLVVNGVLNPGTGSVFNLVPAAAGVSNTISGTGTLGMAGTLNIDLAGAIPSPGATWNLLTTTTVNFDPGFTVTGSGFTPDAGAVGARIWTDGSGDYEFDETTGVLSYIVVTPGYAGWTGLAGLSVGVNDGATDNPDNDLFANVLEYQLNGNPLAFDGNLVTRSEDATNVIFTFERYDLSEADATLNFRWSTSLSSWNSVPIGATSSGPDANGVEVIVTEDGGSTADYDLIQVKLPKSNAVGGKLFGQLEGTSQP